MRSSRGGWVLKSLWKNPSRPVSFTPDNGCSIHIWAVAIDAECVTVLSERSFSSAEISPGGYRVSCTADTSANVSRRRLTAAYIARARRGATIKRTMPMSANGFARLSRSPLRATRPPFHHIMRNAMSVMIATEPTNVTAIVITRMS